MNLDNPAHAARQSPDATDATVRCYWVAQTAEFLRHHFPAELRSRIESAFTPDLGSSLGDRGLGEWVSRDHLVELLQAIASARPNAGGSSDLIACGEFVERRGRNAFTELFMKVLSPELFIKKLPQLWLRDHGRCGRCVVDVCTPHGAVFRLDDVATFTHVAPVWLGWVRAGLTTLGAREIEARQNGWSPVTPGPASVTFEVSWT